MISINGWPTFINVDNIDTHLMVHRLITPDSQLDTLISLFLAVMMTQITGIIILRRGYWADQLCWHSIGQSHISFKDIYVVFNPLINDGSTKQFSWIWQLKVSNIVKIFWVAIDAG